ncbi:hypothetical protein GCM10012319_49310 [Comamonas sp. KCTC 72670]|nr:hypothetical protein GCM10012319_49310 [Comamonas sp. KCTC 72670]
MERGREGPEEDDAEGLEKEGFERIFMGSLGSRRTAMPAPKAPLMPTAPRHKSMPNPRDFNELRRPMTPSWARGPVTPLTG